MEEINKAIERFLTISSGSASGSSLGYGSGYGSGSILGYGSGYGYGDGSGSGSGSGDSLGYGSGYGGGDGSGSGIGTGLKSFNGQKVYYIDDIPTVIERVIGNLAKGYIVNQDLITQKCYIGKSGRYFAHGSTVKEVEKSLQDKIFNNMDVEEKIETFLKEFDLESKYPAKTFYEWHHKLTGSCEFGRNAFVENHGIDIENGMFTVKEFIELTKNAFGGNIISQLEERISKKNKDYNK